MKEALETETKVLVMAITDNCKENDVKIRGLDKLF